MKRTLLSSIFFCTFAGIFSNVALAQSAQAQVVQDSRIPELLKLKSQMTVNDELADRYNQDQADLLRTSRFPTWRIV